MNLRSLVFLFSFSVVIFRDQSNNDQLNHKTGKEETESSLSPFAFLLLVADRISAVARSVSYLCAFCVRLCLCHYVPKSKNRRRGHPTSPAFDFLLLASGF